MLHLFWKYCQRHCTKTYPISSAHKIGNAKSRSEPLVVLNKGKNATSCFSCSKRVFVIYFVPEMMHLLNGNSDFLRKQNFRVMISLISAVVSFTSAVSKLRWFDCCIHKSWGFPSMASLIIFGTVTDKSCKVFINTKPLPFSVSTIFYLLYVYLHWAKHNHISGIASTSRHGDDHTRHPIHPVNAVAMAPDVFDPLASFIGLCLQLPIGVLGTLCPVATSEDRWR